MGEPLKSFYFPFVFLKKKIYYQLSIINYQLSIISYQLSVINHPLGKNHSIYPEKKKEF